MTDTLTADDLVEMVSLMRNTMITIAKSYGIGSLVRVEIDGGAQTWELEYRGGFGFSTRISGDLRALRGVTNRTVDAP